MGLDVAQWSLITWIISMSLVVGYALAHWRAGSPSTRAKKLKQSPEETPTSVESRLAQMAVDQAALFSTLEKLTTTVNRLSSRQGMRETRAAASSSSAPPIGASKAELRRFYGVGPQLVQDPKGEQ